jgi:hypothetical protein
MNETSSHELPDVVGDMLTIGPPTASGIAPIRHVAELKLSRSGYYADVSWCPDVLQLRALRDRCNVILAQHANVDPGPYKLVPIRSTFCGTTIEIESGKIIAAAPGPVIRIDIEGNEDGPAWVGGLDDLAFLSSAIDDVWDRYNPPPETVVKSLAVFATATAGATTELQEALDAFKAGVVIDAEGHLCHSGDDGELIARAEDWTHIPWLKRIAAIVNAVVEARDS